MIFMCLVFEANANVGKPIINTPMMMSEELQMFSNLKFVSYRT